MRITISKLLKVVAALCLVTAFTVLYNILPRYPKDRGEIVGSYHLDTSLIQEELALRSEGTFTQIVHIKATGEVFKSNGRWTFDASEVSVLDAPEVSLDRWIGVLEWPDKLYPDYTHLKPGLAYMSARYWLNSLYLGGSADDWPAYKKLPKEKGDAANTRGKECG